MSSKRRKVSGAEREAERRVKTVGTSFSAVEAQLARKSAERTTSTLEALRERARNYEIAQARQLSGFDSLARLRRLMVYRSELDAEMVEVVQAARSNGMTWVQVAESAGMSRDGAVSRWGRRRGTS
jgi:hypothetical protein